MPLFDRSISFFTENINDQQGQLSEEEAHHCMHVLRKKEGELIVVTDGVGNWHEARLTNLTKRDCLFEIERSETDPEKPFSVHLHITPTKSADRMEWLIEKLTEINVDTVSFLETSNSERSRIRMDRLRKKAIGGLKQSRFGKILDIRPTIPFMDALKQLATSSAYMAAVVAELPYFADLLVPKDSVSLFIGPEGDFTKEEQNAFREYGTCVSLGSNILRTETAGLVACQTINLINRY